MKVTIIPVGMLGTNCYLLSSDQKSCAIIDPGAQPEKIIGLIDEEGLTPKMILLTHGHHDHIGAVKRLMAHYEGMKLYIGENDLEMLTDPEKSYALSRNREADEFIIEGAVGLKEGEELTLDELTVRVLDTPGHTRGSVSFVCLDAMFAGDTLFYRNIGRCDLYGGDYGVMLGTLKKLSQDIKGDLTVYPGHGQATSLDYERKNNHYMAEACR